MRLPTTGRDWRRMVLTTRLVLTVPTYAVVALVAALAGLTLFVASLSLSVIGDLVVGGGLPLDARVRVLASLYPFVGTEFSLGPGLVLVTVAGLFGMNVALLTYHLREHDISAGHGGSAVGLVLGTLGAGCAACGSAIIAGVLSLLASTGLVAAGPVSLTFLPFDGLEFTALALVAVLLSTHWLAEGMRGGVINGCPID